MKIVNIIRIMKSIDLLSSINTKIIFLLPEDIKKNFIQGIDIYVVENYGQKLEFPIKSILKLVENC